MTNYCVINSCGSHATWWSINGNGYCQKHAADLPHGTNHWAANQFPEPDYATCGTCNRTWDDSIVTSMTPAPSARCPFEYFHDGEDIPDDYEVKVVVPTW